ncbi:MAG: hypothetical protein QG622_355 [Actinomycetota bacterium]|nr:hypothetical protein [Actinomycetota bacterium]
MTFTDDADLERRCRAVVRELDLREVTTTQGLVATVSAHLGLSIRLQSFTRRTSSALSGGCLVLEREVVINHPAHADRWYEAMTVGHELGHLLCGHLGTVRSLSGHAVDALLPDLQVAQQAWQLYRCTTMGQVREQEAELVGSLLAAHLEQPWRARRTQQSTRLAGLLCSHRPGPDARE